VARAHALLLENIHSTAEEELGRAGIAVHRVDRGLAEDELIEALSGLPGGEPVMVGLRSKTHVTKRVLESVPRMAAVGAFCIGTDQIDLIEARRRGIGVFNAPFSSTRSVAELVIAEVIMLSRRIFPRNKAAHEGKWVKSASGAHEVRGKTLGIIGYGHIGSQLSILAEALGMQVLFHDIDNRLPLGNAAPAAGLGDLLSRSDFVTLHVPDTKQTRGMIGRKELARLKPGSYLINASRGRVVDIAALNEAIDSGHVAGAAIDVFPREPADGSEPFESELRGRDNVILTPHIGGSTQEAQASIGREVAQALVRWITSGRTIGCVTLPQLDVPLPTSHEGAPASRIVNVHQNVPGVLSSINNVIAESDINIVGQSLATYEDVGLLYIDIPVAADDGQAEQLRASIAELQTSIRTRLVSS
jgi:D-3-phosphoglycerate dehydrogenase / 2-oxoglutarate reductase